MITMMEHPLHGRHPATGLEVEPMKAQGWTVMPPKGSAPQPVPEVEQSKAEAVLEPPRQKRKYTRKGA